MLSGWPMVFLIGIALLAASAGALHLAVRDWKHAIAVGIIALPLMPLLASTVFGDVSRFLPAGFFSDGPDGVGQIVIACSLCMLFGAIILAALIVGAASAMIRKVRA